jgi:hypothetical protein
MGDVLLAQLGAQPAHRVERGAHAAGRVASARRGPRARRRTPRCHAALAWWLLALGFVLMSADEVFELHETLLLRPGRARSTSGGSSPASRWWWRWGCCSCRSCARCQPPCAGRSWAAVGSSWGPRWGSRCRSGSSPRPTVWRAWPTRCVTGWRRRSRSWPSRGSPGRWASSGIRPARPPPRPRAPRHAGTSSWAPPTTGSGC